MRRSPFHLAAALLAACATGPTPPQPALPSATAPPTRVSAVAPPSLTGPPFSAAALMSHVVRLSALDLHGRRAGSDDERRTAELLAHQLDEWGIAPPPSGRFQPFTLAEGTSRNVLALVTGAGPGAGEVVVLGAHMDHLGERDGAVYRGAEDNASGVAVVLEVARALAAHRSELDRSVVVALFGAEEVGMVGSDAFVRHPPVPLETMAAMVNVDMVGRPLVDQAGLGLVKLALRIRDRASVGIVGTRDRPGLRRIVDAACEGAGITAFAPEDFVAPLSTILEALARDRGDNAPFDRAGVATVFFSSGESADYHEPSDVPETLDGDLMASRALAIHRTVVALSRAPRAALGPGSEPGRHTGN